MEIGDGLMNCFLVIFQEGCCNLQMFQALSCAEKFPRKSGCSISACEGCDLVASEVSTCKFPKDSIEVVCFLLVYQSIQSKLELTGGTY